MEEYMNTNSIIAPVKSEILEQSESEVLPACSNPIQTFICSRPSTIESSGSNNIGICLESQNLGDVAHKNNSGLIYNIKQEPVDDYSLTNVYNESQDSTQNSVVNNDSQTSSFSPIIYGNVDSNNHDWTNMKKVSILNKTHVNKEKQSTRRSPTIMLLRPSRRTQKTKNRLSENQSLEPQLDNTDLKFLKDALQNTINRLEDLGVEVAAWVLIPNNAKSSLIHHMGSKKGTEFVKSKPDINTELHLFLQNYKEKGLDDDSTCSCFKDQLADDSIQEDLHMNTPWLVISRKKKRKKLKRKISSVDRYTVDHAYCKKKTTSEQPTCSRSLSANEIELLKAFKFQNEEPESNSVARDFNLTNIFTSLSQKSGIKNMAVNTLLLDKHSSTAEKSNLEIRGDDLINKIKEPVDYEYIEFQSVKPRETVTGSTVHLDTHSSIEKSNLELRGDNLYTHSIKEEPVDYEFIESEAVKLREIVAESTVHLDTHSSTVEKTNLEIRGDNSSTDNIKEEPVDYEFIDFQEANHSNNVTENTVQLDTHSSTAEKSTVRLKEDSFSNDIKEEPIDYEFIETREVKHRKFLTDNTVQDTHSSTAGKIYCQVKGRFDF